MRRGDWPQAQPAAGRNGGLFCLDSTSESGKVEPARETVPAGLALNVTEPRKLHHHVKVITHGEEAETLRPHYPQREKD